MTARLREHYADGRLTSEELDERVTAALSAKTFGDLRRIMVDLPDATMEPGSAPQPPRMPGPRLVFWRGPRLLPLILRVLWSPVARLLRRLRGRPAV